MNRPFDIRFLFILILVFYHSINAGSAAGDTVPVLPVCHSFVDLTSDENGTIKTEHVNNYITSTSDITNSANITYRAGDYIELKNWF